MIIKKGTSFATILLLYDSMIFEVYWNTYFNYTCENDLCKENLTNIFHVLSLHFPCSLLPHLFINVFNIGTDLEENPKSAVSRCFYEKGVF